MYGYFVIWTMGAMNANFHPSNKFDLLNSHPTKQLFNLYPLASTASITAAMSPAAMLFLFEV